MNLNKFTEKAQEAILQAQKLAEEYSHSEILPGHLLLALLRQDGGVVPQIALHLSVNPEAVAQILETELQGAAKVYGGSQPGISRAGRPPAPRWHGRHASNIDCPAHGPPENSLPEHVGREDRPRWLSGEYHCSAMFVSVFEILSLSSELS